MMQHEVPLSLTTPVPRDFDTAFPGESWFFYWKTSASLWKQKISDFAGSKVVVPINWAFHSETGESYDFAMARPETDLAKLTSICQELRKEVVFLLPITPAPFLPNGGVPHLLARNPAMDQEGFTKSVVDPDNNIFKLYSFFDTRIFHAFSMFTKKLGQYLTTSGVSADLMALDCLAISDEGGESFLFDRSSTYEKGFSGYLQAKMSEDDSKEISSVEKEIEYHKEFQETIFNLYLGEVQKNISGHYEGQIKICFLGAQQKDFFMRTMQLESPQKYSQDLLESISLNYLPSSVLIPSRLKRGVLGRMLKDAVEDCFAPLSYAKDIYEDDTLAPFEPLRFFEVFDVKSLVDHDAPRWADISLWDFLQTEYKWCSADLGEQDFIFDESIESQGIIYFFQGRNINQRLFNNILKAFLNGGKIVLNRSGLDVAFLRRLESFFLENSLSVEKVNLFTTVHNVTLGQGRFVVFEGDKLALMDEDKCYDFWYRLIKTFDLRHITIPSEDGIQVLWRRRSTTHSELSFEEIRRVGIYNPTSYKKKLKINVPKNFTLIKVLDEQHVKVRTHPHELELELLPEGSVSFDFGVFS